MLDLLAALALAATPTGSPAMPATAAHLTGRVTSSAASTELTDSHLPAAPWWERITVTLSGDGQSQGCQYTSSTGQTSSDCTIDAAAQDGSGSSEHSASGRDQVTRLTFERRFTPGVLTAADAQMQAGDTLIGREVMALDIDGRGSVKSCKIVANSGEMLVSYGCAEAQAERFQAAARSGAPAPQRVGYMTVLIYAHSEHVA